MDSKLLVSPRTAHHLEPMGFLIQAPDSITPLYIEDYSIEIEPCAQYGIGYLFVDDRYLGAFKVLDI